jgi:hypothetical protein
MGREGFEPSTLGLRDGFSASPEFGSAEFIWSSAVVGVLEFEPSRPLELPVCCSSGSGDSRHLTVAIGRLFA